MSNTPLSEHALLSDCRSAALVTTTGSVDWLCLAHFDSPPVLARLLDNEAGYFLIAPVGAMWPARRYYRQSGLVLETVWETGDGTLVVSDAMALARHDRGHRLGRSSPGVLLRRARCTRGTVTVLLLATVGFLSPEDTRLLATIDAVERHLSDERRLLYRYRGPDGLEGPEGTFLLCTFWLAHALAVTDQTQRARAVLDRATRYATDLGLFAEQVDPDTGELLGNFPQAFSHLGLVTAAQALADAERRTITATAPD